jgi:hypothetical protein
MKRSHTESARDLLRRLPPVDGGDVAVKRLRQRVLDSVSEARAIRPNRSPRMLTRLALGATFFAASAAVVLFWSPWRLPSDTFLASVQSTDGRPILWARDAENGMEWITLRDGAFRVSIRPHAAARRVVVRVPEGRIDDLGTVFDVRIREGRTTDIRVSDGHVQLWFSGANGVVLGTHEVWEAPPASSALPPSTTVEPPARAPQKATPAPKGPIRSTHRSGAPQPATDDGSEDAAYLRVIDLFRAGQDDEARAAARDYVRRFPMGFRRTEMEAVSK